MAGYSTSRRWAGLKSLVGLAVALVSVAALSLLSAGCGGAENESGSSAAPTFSGIALDGSEVSNATFAGRPAVLVFWGTW